MPFPSPGDLPDPGVEPGSPTLQADSLLTEPPDRRMPKKGRRCRRAERAGHGALLLAAELSSGLDRVHVKGARQQRRAPAVEGPGREVTAKALAVADISGTPPSSGHCVKRFKTSSQLILVMPLGS